MVYVYYAIIHADGLAKNLLHALVYGFLTVTRGWVTYGFVEVAVGATHWLGSRHGGPEPQARLLSKFSLFPVVRVSVSSILHKIG